MKPHEERVLAERCELSDRLNKLIAFIESEAFNAIDRYDRGLLRLQRLRMSDYLSVLDERIERFNA
jgi:hypothetical protein